jgi:hypothetical protein
MDDLILQHWEICSLNGEVIDENNLDSEKRLSLPVERLNRTIINNKLKEKYIKLTMNFSFLMNDNIGPIPALSEEEEAIISYIETRPTRNIQSRMLHTLPELKGLSKEKLLIMLRQMEQKKLLLRSGSWYFIASSLRKK